MFDKTMQAVTAASVMLLATAAFAASDTATSPNGKPSGATGTMSMQRKGATTMGRTGAMAGSAGRTNTHGTPHGTTGGTHTR